MMLIKFLQRIIRPFYRLQWKLTLSYTLFTLVTILIVGAAGLGFLWYMNFRSNWLPQGMVAALSKGAPDLSTYLDQTPPDREAVRQWLQKVTPGNNLVLHIPNEAGEDPDQLITAQFGRVKLVAVVNAAGEVVAAAPEAAIPPGETLAPRLDPILADALEAALSGQTDPALLSAREPNGDMLAVTPIFGQDEQVVGAIFANMIFPIKARQFVRSILQGMILPVVLVMSILGLLSGILFGYLSARSLTGRLQALDKAADAWSRGDFDVLARDTSKDELGQLARHFNQMAIHLQNLLETRQQLATLEERNRLARDLHDSVKQQVFATVMQIGAARTLLDKEPEAAKKRLGEAEQLVRQAQQELANLIQELRPAALEDKGLATALRDYVNDWSRQSHIRAEVGIQGARPLPLLVEQTLFRVAQEALANISRHSQATRAAIRLVWEDDEVVLMIQDNGRGFKMEATNGQGMGLRSMRERVEALHGSLILESEPGRGAQIIARLKAPEKEQETS